MNTLSSLLKFIAYRLVPVGSIQAFAGSSAPDGYLWCRGQAVSRTTYADLFAVIGTTYGAGDGSTTFNLPNLGGKVPVGGNSSWTLGNTGGSADAIVPHHRHTYDMSDATSGSTTLTTSQIPAHTHGSKTVSYTFQVRKSGSGASGAFPYNNSTVENGSATGAPNAAGTGTYSLDRVVLSDTHTHNSVGGGGGHTHTISRTTTNTSYAGTSGNTTNANMQPYLVLNYIIRAK